MNLQELQETKAHIGRHHGDTITKFSEDNSRVVSANYGPWGRPGPLPVFMWLVS